MHPTNNSEAIRFKRDYKGFRVSRRFSELITTYYFTCRKCKQVFVRNIKGVNTLPDFHYKCEHKVLDKSLPKEVGKLEAWIAVARYRHSVFASPTYWLGKELDIGLLKFESFIIQVTATAIRKGIERVCPDSLGTLNKGYGMMRDNLQVQADHEEVWPTVNEISSYMRSLK